MSISETDIEKMEAVERADEFADYWNAPHTFRCAHCHKAAGGYTGWDEEFLCESCFLEIA
jgi:hypothetical protein